jgi:putative transcriptional regulator
MPVEMLYNSVSGECMAISYKKLRDLLFNRRIQHKELQAMSGLSNQVMSKINKDEYMSMDALEKIARCLNVQPGDLFSLKD